MKERIAKDLLKIKAVFFHAFSHTFLRKAEFFHKHRNNCLRIFDLIVDHRNRTHGSIGCKYHTISVKYPASRCLDAPLSLLQIRSKCAVILRTENHQVDQTSTQTDRTEKDHHKHDIPLFPVTGQISLHTKTS